MFENFNLSRGARIILEKSYGVKPGMQVLVVTDTTRVNIGEIFARAVREAGGEVVVAVISPCESGKGGGGGEEPSPIIASAIKGCDVCIFTTRAVLSKTRAVRESRNLGIIFVPSIGEGRTECIGEFNTTIDDFQKILETNTKIINALKDTDEVRIMTPSGSDLTLSVKGRPFSSLTRFGPFLAKEENLAEFGNGYKLPDWMGYGEVAVSPVTGSANGTYVVDDWMGGVGAIQEPIVLKIKDGNVVEIRGGLEAERLKELISYGDEYATNVAEFALGTNHVISKVPRGNSFDKAMLGGMHLAIGTSAGEALKGDVESEMHEDGVTLNITIVADGKTIMKDGKLLI